MNPPIAELRTVMERAVQECLAHVDSGGLPFVGVLVDAHGEVISDFGVNRVHETRDPMAHAEIVAMRDAMTTHGLDTLDGTVLLATGEPCGLCYQYALDQGVQAIYVAVDREEVAAFGIDYLTSYPAFGITDQQRNELLSPLRIDGATDPFTRYLELSGQVFARPGTEPKGTSS